MHHGKITKAIAKGLEALRARIAEAAIPPSKLDETLNVATWNVRELGRRPRRDLSLHLIAEVIGQFDLVAIVELRDNLEDLSAVLRYLGPYWRVVFSDYLTDAGGNRERIGYVFDSRACVFTGLASYALPMRKKHGDEYVSAISWWRSPYVASFRAGNFDFVVLTAHIRWGKSERGRIPELALLADWVATRAKEQYLGDKDIIVMGDFNSAPRGAVSPCGLKGPPGAVAAVPRSGGQAERGHARRAGEQP